MVLVILTRRRKRRNRRVDDPWISGGGGRVKGGDCLEEGLVLGTVEVEVEGVDLDGLGVGPSEFEG